MPEEYLPTFNSAAIELNLHRIEGLSENFVFFNDDMYLIQDVKPDDFFLSTDNRGYWLFMKPWSRGHLFPKFILIM